MRKVEDGWTGVGKRGVEEEGEVGQVKEGRGSLSCPTLVEQPAAHTIENRIYFSLLFFFCLQQVQYCIVLFPYIHVQLWLVMRKPVYQCAIVSYLQILKVWFLNFPTMSTHGNAKISEVEMSIWMVALLKLDVWEIGPGGCLLKDCHFPGWPFTLFSSKSVLTAVI